MRKLSCGFVVLSIVAMLAALLTPAASQEVTGSIVGTVTDASGAPIKGAAVMASDFDRGTVWTTQTNETGAYNVLRLPIGNYTVKVTSPGFETALMPRFALVLNQTARVDVQRDDRGQCRRPAAANRDNGHQYGARSCRHRERTSAHAQLRRTLAADRRRG